MKSIKIDENQILEFIDYLENKGIILIVGDDIYLKKYDFGKFFYNNFILNNCMDHINFKLTFFNSVNDFIKFTKIYELISYIKKTIYEYVSKKIEG